MPKKKRSTRKGASKKSSVPKTMQKNISAIKRSIDAMKKKLSKV